MASEIRVNKINSRTGVGTITLSPTGVDFTGIATVATLKATTGIVTTLSATGDVTIGDKIIHDGDTDTAIRFPASGDTFTVETGGSERVRVDSSGNLGINNASPGTKLAIGDGTIDSSNVITFGKRVAGTNSNLPVIGHHSDGSGSGIAICATSSGGKIHFFTGNGSDGFGAESNAEAMRVDHNGQLGIGTVSPAHKLDVHNGNSGVIVARQTTNNGGYNIFEGDDSSGSTKFYVSHNGRVGASEGIIFGSDTADANVLDDYEEGTWTPTVSSAGSVTGEDAKYTKIGNLVHVYGKLTSFTNSSSSNTIVVTSLPFTASTNQAGGSMFGRYLDRTAYTVYVYSNNIEFYSIGSGNFTSLQHSHINNSNAVIYFQATYNVS